MVQIGAEHTIIPQPEIILDLLKEYDRAVPHITKYMGSKRNILDFVIEAINDIYEEGRVCDLFAGTGILSGALGKFIPMHSNDIQEYSSILSKTYLSNYNWEEWGDNILDELVVEATGYIEEIKLANPDLSFTYSDKMTIAEFIDLEHQQQALVNHDFGATTHHLFVRYYSGTYWSYEQCLWIDALRKVADAYEGSSLYYVIISSLMYAMSYNSQSTGHYAQYRDATNKSSKDDILIYRQKEILPFFQSKFNQLKNHLGKNELNHTVTTLDYRACLDQIETGTLVYADPPYAFVHYSRFYHALETLVKYDYPEVLHKGRYRTDRHQSPFCRRTEVNEAFTSLFEKIKEKQADLILSYSNTGMISLERIMEIAKASMGSTYEVSYRVEDHKHSTMGRSDDRSKDVKEYLVIAKQIKTEKNG